MLKMIYLENNFESQEQRCLNTNALGIVIHQSGYPRQDVSAIESITDVVPACQCSTLSTPTFEKLRWFGLTYPSRSGVARWIGKIELYQFFIIQ